MSGYSGLMSGCLRNCRPDTPEYAFREHFIIEGNIGIELHPDNVTSSLIAELKDIGFDIVSFGEIIGRDNRDRHLFSLGMSKWGLHNFTK